MLNYVLIKKGFDINSAPVKLETIKNFLRIDIKNTDQDKLLTKLNLIATQYAENYMQHSIMKNEFLLCFNQTNINKIPLQWGPIISVSKITIFMKNKLTPTELKPNKDYFFRKNSNVVTLIYRIPYLNRVEITFSTGYSTPDLVPLQIKDGILKHVALLYMEKDNSENMLEVRYLYSDFRYLKVAL